MVMSQSMFRISMAVGWCCLIIRLWMEGQLGIYFKTKFRPTITRPSQDLSGEGMRLPYILRIQLLSSPISAAQQACTSTSKVDLDHVKCDNPTK